jgi:sugar transferase EpsL
MKRFFDIVVSACLLLLAGPFMLATAAAVLFFLGTPVFFVQERPGLKGRPFGIIKFRTMDSRTDAAGELLPDHERLGGFGRLLRKTSLDELPELLNVLKGDMSLVGPRPLLTEYLPHYTPRQARRHELRPGLTGWAQVNGRNALDWETRLEMDVWYVDHHSFWLDIKILWLTVLAVFSARGISHGGHATMPKFRGDRTRS